MNIEEVGPPMKDDLMAELGRRPMLQALGRVKHGHPS
jgi:hypothetical protein